MGISATTTSTDLGFRLQPQQKRAQESIELILTSAAKLLDKVGLDAFNTNLLAEYAGIRVRTIYRYFPNKFAIQAELARRNYIRLIDALESFAPLTNSKLPLEERLDILWLNFHNKTDDFPGFAAIRHACRVYPELKSIRDEIHLNLCKEFEAALKKSGVKLKPAKRRLIAALFIETTNAVLDFTETLERKSRPDFINELKVMQCRYLAPYF